MTDKQEEKKSEIKFTDFNFKPELEKAIKEARYEAPSPVQEKSIPIILEGKDLISQAQTGTGKTAAFGLPIIEMMTGKDGVEALIIVPTRELAMQVSDELWKFTRLLNYKTTAVFGGSSYSKQIKFINGASIVVATPGRLLDLLEKGAIAMAPKYVILDEADEMLNMGFINDIKKIFNFLPKERQTLMFSATMPDAIKKLAKEILKNPSEVKITPKNISSENIAQYYYILENGKKEEALLNLIKNEKPRKAIIFCRTKVETEKVNRFLKKEGFKSLALHGDIEQWNRQKITKEFKSRDAHLLAATDVAARGLDIKDITHVFNYSVPQDPEPYVHRIGRTGRAGKSGIAHTFVLKDEIEFLKNIIETVKGNLKAGEIKEFNNFGPKEIEKLAQEIVEQEITKNGNKLINILIEKNGGEEGLFEKIVSHMAEKENSKEGRLSLKISEAEKIVDEFRKRRNSSSRSRFGGSRQRKNSNSNSSRRPQKQERNYKWR